MAMPGQLKTRIDLLKKKIAAQGASLSPAKQRAFRKRLKRLQRARRVALATEKRLRPPQKEAAATGGGESPAAPSA